MTQAASKLHPVEMRTFYNIPIHCPFCGADPQRDMRDGGEPAPCPHTVLIAHSEFWVYLSDRAENALALVGISVERMEGDVAFEKGEDDVGYEDIFEAMTLEDGVIFEQTVGAPSLESSWIAFAPIDSDFPD